MQPIKIKYRKGQALDIANSTMIGLLVLIVTVLAVLLAISTLNPGSFFTAGSLERNATVAVAANTTQVASNFSQQIPVVGTILGIVLILGFIGLLIFIVRRFASGGQTSTL
jgi:beta-lactamase regulating signal transducer with metallopeptidase domain